MNFPHLSVKWSGWIHLRSGVFFSFSGKKRTSFSLISQTRGKKDTWSQVKWVSDTSPRCIDRKGLGRSEASQRLHFVGGSLSGQLVLSTYSGKGTSSSLVSKQMTMTSSWKWGLWCVVPFLAVEAAWDASDVKSFVPVHLVLKVLSSFVQIVWLMAVRVIKSLVVAAFELIAPITANVDTLNSWTGKNRTEYFRHDDDSA